MTWFRKKQTKEQLYQRQQDLILGLTYHERLALCTFTKYSVPVFIQKEIGPFIVDFLGVDRNFILELDGRSHYINDAYDDQRSKYLAKHGFEVFRLYNEEVNDSNIIDIVNLAEIVGIDKMMYLIQDVNKK